MDEKKQGDSLYRKLTSEFTPTEQGSVRPMLMPAKVYEIDGKDRLLLPFALILGLLFTELLFALFQGWGLIVPAVVAAWYAVALWYRGVEGFGTKPSLLLFGAVCALALTFALFSNHWFRIWNGFALPPLLCIHLMEWSGAGRKPWHGAGMLWERLCLTLDALFCHLGAPFKALVGAGEGRRRWVYVALGLLTAVPVLFFVFPLLISADVLFAQFTSGMVDFIRVHFTSWMFKLAFAFFFTPFLFGFLYALRRPKPLKEAAARTPLYLDGALTVTVLVVVDLLYLVFLAVQFTGLFGDGKYLALTGVSYADYARSGFFQLVAVSVFNLALVMLCLHLSKREGGLWQVLRVCATVTVAASVVMLLSAAWKMTLYVTVYGLSFKRFLTYWGMVMLAIFFTAALMKIWRREFSFFRVFLVGGLAGWLLLNYMNVDLIVARYNVALYQREASAVMDLPYLAYLSYDTLGALEELPGSSRPYHDSEHTTLAQLIAWRRGDARRDAADWRTWSVSAQLAAMKETKRPQL